MEGESQEKTRGREGEGRCSKVRKDGGRKKSGGEMKGGARDYYGNRGDVEE